MKDDSLPGQGPIPQAILVSVLHKFVTYFNTYPLTYSPGAQTVQEPQ